MDCKIIKDLIPLSEEGLCSKESKAMIEEHIKDCENCRILCEKMPVDSKSAPVPDEKETFKKVNRKIKKLTWKSGICGVLLLAILGVLGYLTFGQITKMEGLHSFETIAESFEVRKMAKYIADKDFDSLVSNHGNSLEDLIFLSGLTCTEELRNLDVKYLSESYEKVYGNSKVKDISVKSQYMLGGNFGETSIIAHLITIEYDSGQQLKASFIKDANGLYKLISAYDENGNYSLDSDVKKSYENPFLQALTHFSYHSNYLKTYSIDLAFFEDFFRPEYYDTYIYNRKQFYDAGYKIDNIYQNNDYKYDNEKDLLYYDVAVHAHDEKGSAVMTTRLYYDYLGFYSPERDTITVYTDNCTPELEEAMYTFFG